MKFAYIGCCKYKTRVYISVMGRQILHTGIHLELFINSQLLRDTRNNWK